MLLASTNPHEMLPAETAARPVALLPPNCGTTDNHGTQCMSDQLVAAVYYKIKML